jgi:RsiW-degrading membrane proteinase PrsW (M82 family)
VKNKLVAALLFFTVLAPMIVWACLNITKVSDDKPIWDLIALLIGVGIFVFVPLAIIRLLRAK